MPNSRTNNSNSKIRGIIYILCSAFSFAVMSLFVHASGEMPVLQKAFFRNIVAIVFSFVLLVRSEDKFKIKKGSMKYLLLRASFGTLGIVFNFYCISKINIADAQILNKLSPFFATLASIFVLKEKANLRQWLCIFLAFTGALFVVKPEFLTTLILGAEYSSGSSNSFFPALIGVIGGIVAGTAYTFMRKLSLNGERSAVIVAFFSLFSTVVLIPFVIFTYEPISAKQLLLLLGAGLAACFGQLFITSAYACCPAKEISVFDYSSVIFAAILGMIFLNQLPDALSIIGYAIIIGASVISFLFNNGILGKKATEA